MTWEQLSSLTPDNGAIRNLRDLIIAETFTDPELERFFTLVQNAKNGEKIGYRGAMSDVGWAGSGCNPSYKNATIQFLDKEWSIGDWQVPLKWCYTELINTIAEYCLKTGTEIGDLTSTEYMDDIVYPALKDAMMNMMWRFVWFSDKDAKLHSESGVLSTGTDTELFKTTDGLWKRLFTIGTSSAGQKTAIAANSEATMAEQFSKLKESGVAIGIFDAMLENADARIAGLPGAGIFCTKTLADALTKDLKREYKEILTWEQIFGGMKVTEYNGVPVYQIPVWDRMIMKYQNDGTKLNLPHRAVFGSPREMLVGTPANDLISELDIWFDKKDRMNYLYSTGKMGTQIGQDDLFQLAY